MDKELTLEEIKATLRTCPDSAPGPDGIVYSVYDKLWNTIGKHLFEAWSYSKEKGILLESQRFSSITLLPKEGKDLSMIGNWRPITLTNCDLKIFTKTYANRISIMLDKLIHPAQTAYIPGRSVHDNLRMFEFYKNYCNKYDVDAVLMSLDARKAFDSVDHKYMFRTLKHYGFSDEFIGVIRLFYNEIKADILVNGFKTSMIKICRCVKQGDALSCALFILCIDPLIRRIENSNSIKPITIRTPLTNHTIKSKCGAFADDVGAVVKNNVESINGVFSEYERFSKISGICINEAKTEIMPLRSRTRLQVVEAVCYGNVIKLDMVDRIKICGIVFSNNCVAAYNDNVIDKIDKLKAKIMAWQFRGLSLSGKLQVTKTFGISQLIYSMQVCEFKEKDLEEIEKFIFGNLWSKNIGIAKAPDRIKRAILKQEYEQGGLGVPDVKDLNKALKLKQFLRAMEANHVIKIIQKWELESLNYEHELQQEYDQICEIDNVTGIAQITINSLTDKMRSEIENNENPQFMVDLIAITNVKEYLKRQKRFLALNFYNPLSNLGIFTVKQVLNESVYPRSDRIATLAKNVINSFPKRWIELITDSADSSIDIRKSISIGQGKQASTKNITVKMIRRRILKAPDINPFTFERKLGIIKLDNINPFLVNRQANKSEHMRILKFRFLHCDIFCKQRMFKFKMIDDEFCDRCGQIETIKHLTWECRRSKKIWDAANIILRESGLQHVITFNNLFTGFSPINLVVEAIVTKVTQLILQIDRRNDISEQKLKSELVFLGKMNKKGKDGETWENVMNACDTNA